MHVVSTRMLDKDPSPGAYYSLAPRKMKARLLAEISLDNGRFTEQPTRQARTLLFKISELEVTS